DHCPRTRDDPRACPTLARGPAPAPNSGRDHRRHAARRLFPRAAAQALGRLRNGSSYLLRDPARARRRRYVDRLDLWRVGLASLVHGIARRSRRARGLAQRYVRSDLLVADARRPGHACRGRLPPERALEICELLRALRLGAARRHGRNRWRPTARRANLSPAAKGLWNYRHLAGVRPAGDGKL